MTMRSYYLWVTDKHEQLLLFSNTWACVIIADELRMIMSSYYTWVTHENEKLMLMSCA